MLLLLLHLLSINSLTHTHTHQTQTLNQTRNTSSAVSVSIRHPKEKAAAHVFALIYTLIIISLSFRVPRVLCTDAHGRRQWRYKAHTEFTMLAIIIITIITIIIVTIIVLRLPLMLLSSTQCYLRHIFFLQLLQHFDNRNE